MLLLLSKGGLLTAVLVAETSWLFLLAGLLGVATGGGAALLSWPGILVTLLLARLVAHVLGITGMPEGWFRGIGVALAALILYGVLGGHYGGWMWPLRLVAPETGPSERTQVALACVLALALWWRGVRLATTPDLENTLRTGFAVGLGVLIVAAVAQATTHVDVGAGEVAFPLFGASLAGLALATLQNEEQRYQARWVRVLLIVIGGLLSTGFLMGLLVGTAFSSLASGLFHYFGVATNWVFALAFISLEYLIRAFFTAFFWLASLFTGGKTFAFPEPPRFIPPGEAEEAARLGSGFPPLVIAMVKWALLALLILSIIAFLGWVIKVRSRSKQEPLAEVRESIRHEIGPEGSPPLLAGLFPFKARSRLKTYDLPEADDPVSRVYRAYFRLLNFAAKRGQPRQPWETPQEYQRQLETIFPPAPVQRATEGFSRVRYGRWQISPEEAAALEQLVSSCLSD
ncbi:MAG: DUF4129 domain-containing protein [Chloroflexi bacterium]|nr:DUF4129 domain-containing protein [Chloroflexota bacterium]